MMPSLKEALLCLTSGLVQSPRLLRTARLRRRPEEVPRVSAFNRLQVVPYSISKIVTIRSAPMHSSTLARILNFSFVPRLAKFQNFRPFLLVSSPRYSRRPVFGSVYTVCRKRMNPLMPLSVVNFLLESGTIGMDLVPKCPIWVSLSTKLPLTIQSPKNSSVVGSGLPTSLRN
jgi:hypothetical protein